MTNSHAGSSPADRYDHIAEVLKSYPDINDEQLQELKQWFREASAFDIASLASNDKIVSGYSQFRADHVDKVSAKDMIFMIIIIFTLLSFIGTLVYLSP